LDLHSTCVHYCRPYICNRLCVYVYPNECVYISYRVCAYLAVQTMNKQVNCYSCFVINGRSKVLAAHRTYVDLSTKTHCVHSVNINYIATADTFAACMYRYILGGWRPASCLPTQGDANFEHLLLTNRCSCRDANRKLFD